MRYVTTIVWTYGYTRTLSADTLDAALPSSSLMDRGTVEGIRQSLAHYGSAHVTTPDVRISVHDTTF